MSDLNNIAYHGSSAGPEIIRAKGLTPPCHRAAVEVLATAHMPDNVIGQVVSYLPGPVLRPTIYDADPDWSVSLSWTPAVSCFFPPKYADIYVYAVSMKGIQYPDVDKYALVQSKKTVDRSYMQELAVRSVHPQSIIGYFVINRKDPPADIKYVVNHQMLTAVQSSTMFEGADGTLWGSAVKEVMRALSDKTVKLQSLGASFKECPF